MNQICAAHFRTELSQVKQAVASTRSVTRIVLKTPEGKLSAQVMVPEGAATDQPPLVALHGI